MDNESRAADALELLELLRQDGAARVARFSGPFNFSAINNAGAKLARGEIWPSSTTILKRVTTTGL